MCSRLLNLLVITALLAAGVTPPMLGADQAAISPVQPASPGYRGYVEIPWTPTVCSQGNYFLTDPCTGGVTLLQPSGLGFDRYLCQYVDLSGPDVGVECPVIDPIVVTPGQAPCPIPPATLTVSGGATAQTLWSHVICAASYDLIRGDLLQLSETAASVDLGSVTCLANDLPEPHFYVVQGPQRPVRGHHLRPLERRKGEAGRVGRLSALTAPPEPRTELHATRQAREPIRRGGPPRRCRTPLRPESGHSGEPTCEDRGSVHPRSRADRFEMRSKNRTRSAGSHKTCIFNVL